MQILDTQNTMSINFDKEYNGYIILATKQDILILIKDYNKLLDNSSTLFEKKVYIKKIEILQNALKRC